MSWLRQAWLGLRFRDALLLTIVPLVALALTLGGALGDYIDARQFDDWWSRSRTVDHLFTARVNGLATLPTTLRLRDQLDPDAPDAGIIRLELPATSWDSIEGNGQTMWGEWVDATLRYGETRLPVRLRKRGDNSVHWLTEKRSLTVRTPRDDFYKRFRAFGLSAKDVLPNYLGNRLAQEFGILAPATEVVPVYLNSRFLGMYRLVEVVDESFLRPFDRMPGNIFRGDAAERSEYRKGAPRGLYENPYLWDRAAANDRVTSAGTGQLRLLIEDVTGTTFADHERMMGRLDRDEFARLFAYLFIAGDPYHMDNIHNQLLYEDPSTQQLHPIPWDTRVLDLSQPQPTYFSDLFKAVLRDPFVVDATMREVARQIAGDHILTVADSLVTTAEKRYASYFAADRLRAGLIPPVGTASEAVRVVGGNVALLRTWVADARVAVAVTPAPGSQVVDVVTHGFVGVDLTGFELDQSAAGSVRVVLDRNRNGVLDAADPALPLAIQGRHLGVSQSVPLYAAWDPSGHGVRPAPQHYRMFLTGLPHGARVTPDFINRITGTPAEVDSLASGSVLGASGAWHAWEFPEAVHRMYRLSGEVHLHETLKIAAGDTLTIEPGTTLRLDPEVSIVSRGLVLARGTQQRPIRMLPASTAGPWGTFALQGAGTSGSVVSNAEIAGGGGAVIDRIEYTGMVNVHWANDVVFDHIFFHDNVRSDDTFHGMHSRIVVRNSHFLRANSDALDMDITSGEIRDNVFEYSGNDALDLMTSTPRIINNRMIGSGDKGISVGEASRPFIFNNVIDSCDIGIEVKDRSEPIILNNVITRNRIGLRERRKNWRYGGGGWATVAATRFAGNRTPRARDVYSRLTLLGTAGLDSAGTATVVEAGDLAWLYASVGVMPEDSASLGPLVRWHEFPPVVPIDQERFSDDFGPISDGWVGSGSISRLEKRRDALVVEVSRRAGTITRPVDWQLPAGGTLILEYAGRDVGALVLRVGGDSTIVAPAEAGIELATARFATLRLAPGHYSSLAIDLTPVLGLTRINPNTGLREQRGGRLDLRGYLVVPTAAPAMATR
ncbi:MAG: CotH kinase family protein [Gemmatimonadales bacterium]